MTRRILMLAWCIWTLYSVQGSSTGYAWKPLRDFEDTVHDGTTARATTLCLAALRDNAGLGPLKPVSLASLEQNIGQSTGTAPIWYACYPAISEGFSPYKQ